MIRAGFAGSSSGSWRVPVTPCPGCGLRTEVSDLCRGWPAPAGRWSASELRQLASQTPAAPVPVSVARARDVGGKRRQAGLWWRVRQPCAPARCRRRSPRQRAPPVKVKGSAQRAPASSVLAARRAPPWAARVVLLAPAGLGPMRRLGRPVAAAHSGARSSSASAIATFPRSAGSKQLPGACWLSGSSWHSSHGGRPSVG